MRGSIAPRANWTASIHRADCRRVSRCCVILGDEYRSQTERSRAFLLNKNLGAQSGESGLEYKKGKL